MMSNDELINNKIHASNGYFAHPLPFMGILISNFCPVLKMMTDCY